MFANLFINAAFSRLSIQIGRLSGCFTPITNFNIFQGKKTSKSIFKVP